MLMLMFDVRAYLRFDVFRDIVDGEWCMVNEMKQYTYESLNKSNRTVPRLSIVVHIAKCNANCWFDADWINIKLK